MTQFNRWAAACVLVLAGLTIPAPSRAAYAFHPIGGSAAYGASAGQYGGYSTINPQLGLERAILWTDPYAAPLSLDNSPSPTSEVLGLDNGRQVGYRKINTTINAGIWSGTDASFVSLAPAGFSGSRATAIRGNSQAGYAYTGANDEHAILWHNTAGSAVDLHPGASFTWTLARGTDGVQQVGQGRNASITTLRALLWTGTAASMLDLTPAGAGNANALGVDGGRQVGGAALGGPGTTLHPMVWNGSSSNFLDLTPAGMDGGQAFAIRGNTVVGEVFPAPGQIHAYVWDLSNGTGFDLSTLTTPNTVSIAYGLDEVGNIVGTANNGMPSVWLVPEPTSWAAAAICFGVSRLRRRRTGLNPQA